MIGNTSTYLLIASACLAFASASQKPNKRFFGGLDSNGFGGVGGGLGVGGGYGIGGGLGGVGSLGGVASSGSCRYWCRTPQGQSYCCESGQDLPSLPSVKPGQCPPVRPQCPPTRTH